MEKQTNKQTDIIPKERNYWLDNAKFLLILLVVVVHFISRFRKYEIINYLYFFVFLFHMPLFIFITGFFSKKVVTNGKNKVLNFMVLYVIMQIIELMIAGKSITIIKPAFALWYLQAIIIYNLLLPIIHKMKPIAACIIAVSIGLLIGFDNNANTIASLSRTFVMLPFFMMGYFITEEYLNKLKTKKNMIFAVLFLILIVSIIPILLKKPIKFPAELLLAKSPYKNMNLGYIGILYRAAWYLLATFTSLSVLALVPKRRIKLISKFGSRTLQVYCLHAIIILIFKQTTLYTKINTELEIIGLIICSTILTFILSLKIFSYPFDFIMKRKFKLIYKNNEISK